MWLLIPCPPGMKYRLKLIKYARPDNSRRGVACMGVHSNSRMYIHSGSSGDTFQKRLAISESLYWVVISITTMQLLCEGARL